MVIVVHGMDVAQDSFIHSPGKGELERGVVPHQQVGVVLMREHLQDDTRNLWLTALAVVAVIHLAACPLSVGGLQILLYLADNEVADVTRHHAIEAGGVATIVEIGGVDAQRADGHQVAGVAGIGVQGDAHLDGYAQALGFAGGGVEAEHGRNVRIVGVDVGAVPWFGQG